MQHVQARQRRDNDGCAVFVSNLATEVVTGRARHASSIASDVDGNFRGEWIRVTCLDGVTLGCMRKPAGRHKSRCVLSTHCLQKKWPTSALATIWRPVEYESIPVHGSRPTDKLKCQVGRFELKAFAAEAGVLPVWRNPGSQRCVTSMSLPMQDTTVALWVLITWDFGSLERVPRAACCCSMECRRSVCV